MEREAARRRGEKHADRAASEKSVSLRRGIPTEVRELARRAFATLAENVRDYAIFLMDPGGIIRCWGEGARLIKGWTAGEAEGAHLRLLYPDGGSEDGTAEEHLAHAAENGEYIGEGQRVRSDGSNFWAAVTLTALRTDEGQVIGFAKVTRDLTARRAAEEALALALVAEEARSAAEESNRLKSAFLTTMSHELRTPLNAIVGYHELLEAEVTGPLGPQQREHVARATAATKHLLGLVNEILDLSRLEAGRLEVGQGAFDISPVVRAALDLVRVQAAARNLVLDDALSDSARHMVCWGDEDRARQILVNLLSNAVKFTEPGGCVTLRAGASASAPVNVALPGEGPWICVEVEDTGPGIPPERLTTIFEPFVQTNAALTRRHGGTGLGLAISRRLARLMGGDITARSQVGVGSTFVLWLPAADQEREWGGHSAGAAPPSPS